MFRSIPEYTTFADIAYDHRGYRKLMHTDGYAFGVNQEKPDGQIRWRCTLKYARMGEIRKKMKCRAFLITKKINGFDIIKNPFTKHDH